MNVIKHLLGLFIVSLIISCGKSTQEKELMQKVREDSIRNAVEQITRQRLEKIQSFKDQIVQAESEIEGMRNRLKVKVADMEVAREKLNRIKEFQLLRTESEKEQQIRDQVILIEDLDQQMTNLQTNIGQREKYLTKIKNELDQIIEKDSLTKSK